jgi:hypothetical protein
MSFRGLLGKIGGNKHKDEDPFEKALYEGALYKEGEKNKSWKLRYFKLTNSGLKYYAKKIKV